MTRLMLFPLLLAPPLMAQLPERVVVPTPILTVTTEQLDITEIGPTALTEAGDLVLGDPDELTIVVVTPEGRVSRFGRSGEGPGEFRNIREVSIHGGLIWVTDNGLHRFSGFTAAGKYVKSLSYPLFSSFPDQTKVLAWPVVMTSPTRLLMHVAVLSSASTRYVNGMGGLAFQAPEGTWADEVAWIRDTSPCMNEASRRGEAGPAFNRPFCSNPLVGVSSNGIGALIIEPDSVTGENATFTLSVHDLRKHTISATRIGYVPRAVRASDREGLLNRPIDPRMPKLRGTLAALTPPKRFQPFRGGILLNDLVALVQVYPEDRDHSSWVIIAKGRAVGLLELGIREVPLAGTSRTLWVSSRDEDGLLSARLYRWNLPSP